jgi:hypothetical protein
VGTPDKYLHFAWKKEVNRESNNPSLPTAPRWVVAIRFNSLIRRSRKHKEQHPNSQVPRDTAWEGTG